MLFILSIIFFATLGIFYYLSKSTPKNLPPSVPSLPIVGSLPYFGPDMRINIRSFEKKEKQIEILNI